MSSNKITIEIFPKREFKITGKYVARFLNVLAICFLDKNSNILNTIESLSPEAGDILTRELLPFLRKFQKNKAAYERMNDETLKKLLKENSLPGFPKSIMIAVIIMEKAILDSLNNKKIVAKLE